MGKIMKNKHLQVREAADEEKQIESANKKIQELKEEFRNRTYNHIGNLYKILDKIVKLRQYSDKNYRPRSLEWEEDINITAMQIRYIFSYQYISTYAEDKVKEGSLTDTAMCHFLSCSSLLRESQWQNRLVDKIIDGGVKVSEVSELRVDELKLFLLGKLTIRKDDKYLLTATKTLRGILNRLESRKELINGSVYSKNLINSIRKLNKFANALQKDGE